MGLPCNHRVGDSNILLLRLRGRQFGNYVTQSAVSLAVSDFFAYAVICVYFMVGTCGRSLIESVTTPWSGYPNHYHVITSLI